MKQHQHYIPESYLKNFSKNRSGRVIAYKRDGTFILGKAKDFCGENEFYSFIQESGETNRGIEDMFGVVDDGGATAIRRLLHNEDPASLTEEDRINLALFFSFLLVRDRRYKEQIRNMVDLTTRIQFRAVAFDKLAFKKLFDDYDEELSDDDLKMIRETILSDRYEVGCPGEHWLEIWMEMAVAVFPHVLEKKYWSFTGVHYPDEVIIVSDSPATVLQPTDPRKSLGVANGILYLPLSPSTCLFFHDEEDSLAFLMEEGANHIAYLNHHQMFNAYRYIFSDFLMENVASAFVQTSKENSFRIVAKGPADLIPRQYREDG